MSIVSSGSISIKNVGDEKGLSSTNLSLASLSTTNVNTNNPVSKVGANTSTALGNYPDVVVPHRLSEFYAYDHTYATTTTSTTSTTSTTIQFYQRL